MNVQAGKMMMRVVVGCKHRLGGPLSTEGHCQYDRTGFRARVVAANTHSELCLGAVVRQHEIAEVIRSLPRNESFAKENLAR
jgi:hypothetical protein